MPKKIKNLVFCPSVKIILIHAYKEKILITWQNQSVIAQRQDSSPKVLLFL